MIKCDGDLDPIYVFHQFDKYLVLSTLYQASARAQKTKMINTQWLTNSDIYRSEIKTND